MKAVVLNDGKDRAAWLAARQGVVSASDVASVLGFGGQSRAALLREKVTGKRDGGDPGGLAMVAAGRHIESAIMSWYTDESLDDVQPNRALLGCSDGQHPWLAATPDGIINGAVPLEIKNVMFESGYNWRTLTTPMRGWPQSFPFPVPVSCNWRVPPYNTQVAKADVGTLRGNWRQACTDIRALLPSMGDACAPAKYVMQAMVQAHVLASDTYVIVVCIGGATRIDMTYQVDHALLAWALEECEAFWAEVVSKRAQSAVEEV